MKIEDLGLEDNEFEESDWETEFDAAVEYAEDYGLAFFVVFADGNMARCGFEEISEILNEWRLKVATS